MSRLDHFDRFDRGVVAVLAAGLLATCAVVLIGGAPVAWVMLALSGAICVAALLIQLRQRRFFDPLTVVAAVGLLSFVARPLQLFLNVNDLLSWRYESSDVDRLLRTENQETRAIRDARASGGPRAGPDACHGRGHDLPRALRGRVPPAVRAPARRPPRASGRRHRGHRRSGGRRGLHDHRVRRPGGRAHQGRRPVRCRQRHARAGGPQRRAGATRSCSASARWACWYGLLGARRAQPAPRSASWRPRSRCAPTTRSPGTRTRVFLSLLMVAVVTHYLWRPWRLREVLAGRARGRGLRGRAARA